MGDGPGVDAGQVYADRDEESGAYQVSKVLYADDQVVVTRRYVNRFDERPAEVPPGLRLDLTPEALERGEIGIGWGAIAIDAEGFAQEDLVLLGTEPVTDEEAENARVALDPGELERGEGVWSRLKRVFGGSRGDEPPA
jgi:hypothetical protein